LGFQVIGTLPKAFNSKNIGYVDALVLYKELKHNNALNSDAVKFAVPVSGVFMWTRSPP